MLAAAAWGTQVPGVFNSQKWSSSIHRTSLALLGTDVYLHTICEVDAVPAVIPPLSLQYTWLSQPQAGIGSRAGMELQAPKVQADALITKYSLTRSFAFPT